MREKNKATKRKLWFWLLFLPLLGVLIFSGVKLWGIYSDYHKGDQVQQELLQYKPQRAENASGGNPDGQMENWELIELQRQYPDVRGWLTIDDTSIDYVFRKGRITIRICIAHWPENIWCPVRCF